MPDIPASALAAAEDAIRREFGAELDRPGMPEPDALARVALEAAAPVLAETLLTPLLKRHPPIASDRGGHYCGTCWDKHGSRHVWPCPEMLAIGDLLPGDIPEVPGE